MTTVDRASPVPIYHQLKSLIRERIELGIWRPGDRIPTEHELCDLYGISRAPVRQALTELAQEGLVTRRPGLGTFVHADALSATLPEVSIRAMGSDPYWPPVLDYIGRIWNVEHPRQRIAFNVESVAYDGFYRQLNAAVGRGTAPDVAIVDCVHVAELAKTGYVYAIDEVNSWLDPQRQAELYPAFAAANSYDGRLYALPFRADVSLLWYRQDWFAQEGIAPPRDWDDLRHVAEHFSKPAVKASYGLEAPLAFPGGRAGGESTVYSLMPFVWSAGSDVFQDDVVVLDGPGTRRALAFLRDLVAQGGLSLPDVTFFQWSTAPWMFAKGKVAMSLGGSYETDIIMDASGWTREEFMARVGCVAPPAAPGGAPVSAVGGTSHVVLRQSKHPGLVLDVLRIAADPDAVGGLFRSRFQNSPFSAFNAFLSSEAEPVLTQVSRLITSGRARPSIPEYALVSRQLQAMFEAAVVGTLPVDEAARRTAEFISVVTERRYVRT
ncbi:MAG: extracellular solute-binding protein [Anaerolineales bacterium]|nr:extracellular solute-binding protein [Anaerolineales bacterium]